MATAESEVRHDLLLEDCAYDPSYVAALPGTTTSRRDSASCLRAGGLCQFFRNRERKRGVASWSRNGGR